MMVKNYKEVLYDNESLETNRLLLRKAIKSDAAGVFECGGDAETVEHLDWEGVQSEEEALNAIIEYNWSRPGIWVIEHKEDKKYIGAIDIRIEPENESSSFGYMLNRNYWGKGYMTEALSEILRLCFEELDLNRVWSCHYTGNEASGKVMQKCGMKYEGVSEQERKIKGVFRDVVRYGITKKQWLINHSGSHRKERHNDQ